MVAPAASRPSALIGSSLNTTDEPSVCLTSKYSLSFESVCAFDVSATNVSATATVASRMDFMTAWKRGQRSPWCRSMTAAGVGVLADVDPAGLPGADLRSADGSRLADVHVPVVAVRRVVVGREDRREDLLGRGLASDRVERLADAGLCGESRRARRRRAAFE